VFSFLRTPTTWHCPHSPAAAAERRPCSNPLPAAAKPVAAGLLQWTYAGTDRQTDRQTDTVPLHRPCSAYCIVCNINANTSVDVAIYLLGRTYLSFYVFYFGLSVVGLSLVFFVLLVLLFYIASFWCLFAE